jgi:hypothetical protein
MLRTALPILFLCVSVHAQTNSTLTFNATGTGTAAGAGLSFLVTGTSTLTGFGTAQLLASSTIPTLAGVVTGTPITSSVTMIFSTGDVLSGQLVVPAGYLIPQLGQTTSGAASFTITSGSGAFLNASGYFPNLTISSTPTGSASASIQGSGTGTVLVPSAHVAGTLSYAGAFAHFASGAGWETIITLVNKGTASAQAQVNFYDESGNPSTVPLDFPQGGPTLSGPNYTTTIQPGAVAVIESQGGTNLSVGSVQLLSDNKVSGFLIFRYLPTVQEAAVNLQVQNASTYTLPFDNTGGISTGVALSTTSASATTVQIAIQDDKGTLITTDTVTLPARGHHSFVLNTSYTAAAGVRGTIQFQSPAGSQIGVIGIRALATGAYTTIPPIGN